MNNQGTKIQELISKYPRIMAVLFAATFSGLVVVLAWAVTGSNPGMYVISIMSSAGFWAAILGRRITDVSRICTYFRAAMLGAIIAVLVILSIAILSGIELKLETMVNGSASVQQATNYMLIEDLFSNPHRGYFALLVVGTYFATIGVIAGMLLRWLRKLYELDEHNELYEGDDRPNLYSDDE